MNKSSMEQVREMAREIREIVNREHPYSGGKDLPQKRPGAAVSFS